MPKLTPRRTLKLLYFPERNWALKCACVYYTCVHYLHNLSKKKRNTYYGISQWRGGIHMNYKISRKFETTVKPIDRSTEGFDPYTDRSITTQCTIAGNSYLCKSF